MSKSTVSGAKLLVTQVGKARGRASNDQCGNELELETSVRTQCQLSIDSDGYTQRYSQRLMHIQVSIYKYISLLGQSRDPKRNDIPIATNTCSIHVFSNIIFQ